MPGAPWEIGYTSIETQDFASFRDVAYNILSPWEHVKASYIDGDDLTYTALCFLVKARVWVNSEW